MQARARGAALWESEDESAWREALDRYEAVAEGQKVAALPELDRWTREDLPERIAARRARHVTYAELVRVTEWKMARGVWRARNLVLVKGNPEEEVVQRSTDALALIPHERAPIAELSKLAGVGPATASAVAAAAAPEHYPFFDELVAAQVPSLGPVVFTPAYYARYAAELRGRARRLGARWTPVAVERALWSSVGGKAGA